MKLELRGITKRFPGVVANDSVDLEVSSGEIIGLLGENGAGKSTLMNILYGLYSATEGDIVIDGQVMHFESPSDAIAAGIGMVHQHFMLVPVFSVVENVVLGDEPTRFGGVLNLRQGRTRLKEISDRYGLAVDPDAVIVGVHRALKPGGRFVGEFGGHGNVAAITVALLAVLARRGIDGAAISPWYFPTADAYGERLQSQGFDIQTIELIPRPTPLPTDMEGWLRTMAGPFFAALEKDDRAEALAETVRLLKPSLCDHRGNWTADYVRLRFHAQRTS